MKGLSISHISLPIKIFEPRSSIQRICDLWTFAPKFLKQAALIDDHLERLKLVIAFNISAIYLTTSQNKPFNPLLGETLQGHFDDGSKFLAHDSLRFGRYNDCVTENTSQSSTGMELKPLFFPGMLLVPNSNNIASTPCFAPFSELIFHKLFSLGYWTEPGSPLFRSFLQQGGKRAKYH